MQRFLPFLLAVLPAALTAQTVRMKNNLLWDALLTPNIGVEVGWKERWSAQVGYGYSPFTLGEGKKLRNWSVTPELCYYLGIRHTGHFVGVQANAGQANLGGVKLPFHIWKNLAERRYEANFAGGGLAYGYVWPLSGHWALEASVGLGYEWVDYREYACPTCDERIRHKTKHYIGPQKATLSVVYEF